MAENPCAPSYTLGMREIQRFLPHRSPFLLVDRILEIHPVGNQDSVTSEDKIGTRVVAVKNVSFNEPYFPGHFPGLPLVPGVLMIESMAQVASFSIYPALCKDIDRLAREFQCILVGVNSARFRKPVVPGDVMKIETVVSKGRGKLWVFDCEATVEGKTVASAEIMANLISNSA